MSEGSTEGELLLPGDWVEVRLAPEILATLDRDQAVAGLPFMPEMAVAFGRRFRVALRAERTCVQPPERPFRKLADAVVLDGLRCDGSAHGGCQLGCLMLWKEAWLRRVDGPGDAPRLPAAPAPSLRVHRGEDPDVFFCQGTELVRATTRGDPLLDPGQYLRFVRTRTFTVPELAAMFARIGGRFVARHARAALRRGPPPPPEAPAPLGIVPGEWVRVKEAEGIRRTLDARGRFRGLAFGGEMERFCGRRMRVWKRVERILSEETGRLRSVRDTVLLEGGICDRHWGCARGMPILWREAWLERA